MIPSANKDICMEFAKVGILDTETINASYARYENRNKAFPISLHDWIMSGLIDNEIIHSVALMPAVRQLFDNKPLEDRMLIIYYFFKKYPKYYEDYTKYSKEEYAFLILKPLTVFIEQEGESILNKDDKNRVTFRLLYAFD